MGAGVPQHEEGTKLATGWGGESSSYTNRQSIQDRQKEELPHATLTSNFLPQKVVLAINLDDFRKRLAGAAFPALLAEVKWEGASAPPLHMAAMVSSKILPEEAAAAGPSWLRGRQSAPAAVCHPRWLLQPTSWAGCPS